MYLYFGCIIIFETLYYWNRNGHLKVDHMINQDLIQVTLLTSSDALIVRFAVYL